MRAQRRNQTRTFLIKDDFPPAVASNALHRSPIMLWSGGGRNIRRESAPRETSCVNIQLATSQYMYCLPTSIFMGLRVVD